ncbi:thiaminase II [Pelagibius litoralis]|uniref:Aminopyrimidine aminohydrolase n=1 Tax=Pelagibius litoralis TaxID=374515 RepID=A0A967EV05_9PROT|nr:thiaminase II [Pelagibius litoralis]NIA67817.1 thiaminase II [Pelagibius litoralis]
MTRFSETAWQSIAPLYGKIADLPFNRELAAGSLSPERFRFYILQDSLYLAAYARALSLAAARAPDGEAATIFTRSAQGAIEVEQALHGGILERFGVDRPTAEKTEASPTCFAYTNFLLAAAQKESFEVLAAAILPCFWIYWKIGCGISEAARPENPYAEWIATYSDPAFGAATQSVVDLCDRAALAAGSAERARMLTAFIQSSRYEWMFWDSAYRQEGWPV